MIHAIPFKVVHPCPRPRAVPPRVATTTTSRRSSLLYRRFLSFSRTRLPLCRLLPFIPPSRSRALARSLARSLAHARTRTHSEHRTHTHICIDAYVLSLSLSLSLALPLALFPYWLSIPACNDSMALPHPCAIQ